MFGRDFFSINLVFFSSFAVVVRKTSPSDAHVP